jgi:hypothetical protein
VYSRNRRRTKKDLIMNKRNKLRSLPREDQQRIIALCDKHTYEQVKILLAKPRPQGLALQTSASALCRFNSLHNPSSCDFDQLIQLTAELAESTLPAQGTLIPGIASLVERQVFTALSHGESLTALLPEFRLMRNLHRDLRSRPSFPTASSNNRDLPGFPPETPRNSANSTQKSVSPNNRELMSHELPLHRRKAETRKTLGSEILIRHQSMVHSGSSPV